MISSINLFRRYISVQDTFRRSRGDPLIFFHQSRVLFCRNDRVLSSTRIANSIHGHGASKNRKRKSLNQQKGPQTVKGKIRNLVEKNIYDNRSILRKDVVSELLDKAQSRVMFFRTKLFKFWNPDYEESYTSNGREFSTISNRPMKESLVMDERWWRWNILLAPSPGIIIALYCELIGKEQMRRYSMKQDLVQMEKLMGPEFVAEYEKEQLRLIQDGSIRSYWNQVVKIYEDFRIFLAYWMKQSELNEHQHVMPDEVRTGHVTPSTQGTPKNDARMATPILSTEIDSSLIPASSVVETGRVLNNDEDISNISKIVIDQSIQDLQNRVRELEMIVKNQETHMQQQEEHQSYEFHRRRLNQSGIRNRNEDNLMLDFERRLKELHEKKRFDSETSPTSIFDHLPAKEMMRDYLTSFLERCSNFKPYPENEEQNPNSSGSIDRSSRVNRHDKEDVPQQSMLNGLAIDVERTPVTEENSPDKGKECILKEEKVDSESAGSVVSSVDSAVKEQKNNCSVSQDSNNRTTGRGAELTDKTSEKPWYRRLF